jgi:hypothetical protein
LLFPNMKYVGYKSKLDSLTTIGDINALVVPEQPCEFYTSIYRFGEDVAGLSSLAGLPPGTVGYADFLVLDLDSHDDLDSVYRDCMAVCAGLDAIEAVYEVYFSGGKGFHVCIPTSQFGFEPTSDETILKRMAEGIKGEITSWDPSIYNKTRVFRYPGTWNQKGGMYKIVSNSLDDNSLWGILSAAEVAPEGFEQADYSNLPLNEALCRLYEFCKQPTKEVSKSTHIVGDSLFAPAGEGGRNERAYTVANMLFKKGLFKQDVEWVLDAWNSKNPKPLPAQELQKVIYSAEKGRIELAPSNLDLNFHSIDGLLDTIPAELASGKMKFRTGYKFIDDYTLGGFEEEEAVFIASRSGNFKTAFLTNIMMRGSLLAKKPCLFFSMEMSKKTLRPRLIQTAEDMTKGQVLQEMAKGNTFAKTREAFKYLNIVHLSNITTEQMMDLVEAFIKKHGEIGAIGIDYLGLFRGCNNNTERTARQAQDIKTVIAKAAKCPVFTLVQAKQSFEGREGNVELLRNCPKDSDSVLDLGDYALGFWSHFVTMANATEERILFGKFMKSRGLDSDNFKPNPYFCLKWKKETMTLEDIIYLEKSPYKFRQLKEEG